MKKIIGIVIAINFVFIPIVGIISSQTSEIYANPTKNIEEMHINPTFYNEKSAKVTQNCNEKGADDEFYLNSKVPKEYQEIAYEYSIKYDVDFPLIVAVIEVESGGNANAISETNDYGLMQINECNHEWLKAELGIKEFLDPRESIKAGTYMLSRLYKVKNDTRYVLMAYNMGGYAKELWNNGIHRTEYTDKVLSAEKRMVEDFINED